MERHPTHIYICLFFSKYQLPSVGVRIVDPLCDFSSSKPRSVSLEKTPTRRALKMRIGYGVFYRDRFFSTSVKNPLVEIKQFIVSDLVPVYDSMGVLSVRSL